MAQSGGDQVPSIQKYFDSPFFLLFVGFMTVFVFYTAWGIYEILTMPAAQLP